MTFDGQRAMTGGKDGPVRLWKLPAGERDGVLEQRGEVYSLALASDGHHLVVNHLADGRMAVSIWTCARAPALHGTRARESHVRLRVAVDLGRGPAVAGDPGRPGGAHLPALRTSADRICGSPAESWVACAHGPDVHVWEADETHRVVERSLVVTRVRGHREGRGRPASLRIPSRGEPGAAQCRSGRGSLPIAARSRQVRGYDRDPEALELLGRMLGVLPRGRSAAGGRSVVS